VAAREAGGDADHVLRRRAYVNVFHTMRVATSGAARNGSATPTRLPLRLFVTRHRRNPSTVHLTLRDRTRPMAHLKEGHGES